MLRCPANVAIAWISQPISQVGAALQLISRGGTTPTLDSLSAAPRTAVTPETRARAVAGAIRTDGAVAAKLLLDAVSPERLPASA